MLAGEGITGEHPLQAGAVCSPGQGEAPAKTCPQPNAGSAAESGADSPAAVLQRIELELEASRKRLAEQQARMAEEQLRQEGLARELADLRSRISGSPAVAPTMPTVQAVPAAAGPGAAVSYTPGQGFTLQSGESRLRVWAEAKLLGISSSRYTFNPGQPLVVSPKDPASSYDLTAQQSVVGAAFQGPRWGSWTPGGFALFTLQDNILAEGYSFTPVVFYGEIGDGGWRVAAGQQFDLFAPRDPDNLTTGKLAASGNPGAYRPQFRLERKIGSGAGTQGLAQLAVSAPITTALPDNVDLGRLQEVEIVEDNGWPNVEGRLSVGFGAPAERAGGQHSRPLELGVSGVMGQLRVLDNIRPTDPITLVSDRSVVSVWGAAFDGKLALGRNVSISGELYTGQGLGEYMAGIFQTYNRLGNQAVPTSGGWGQISTALTESFRFNAGYGIDNASDSGRFGLKLNSSVFANVVWDVNPWLQLGLEGNYKLTDYDSFGDKDAWVVISQVLLRL
jgi:hypothetical protein